MIPVQSDVGLGYIHHHNRLAARLKLHAGLDIHVFRKSILINSDQHFLAPRTVGLLWLNPSRSALAYFKSKYSGLETQISGSASRDKRMVFA